MILIPLGSALIIGFFYTKYAPAEKQIWKVAIAVLVGQAVWFISGLVVLRIFDANALDPIALIVGANWLYFRPGITSVAFLGIIQAVSMVVNISDVIVTEIGSTENKASLVHMVSVGAMGYALFSLKKQGVKRKGAS